MFVRCGDIFGPRGGKKIVVSGTYLGEADGDEKCGDQEVISKKIMKY